MNMKGIREQVAAKARAGFAARKFEQEQKQEKALARERLALALARKASR